MALDWDKLRIFHSVAGAGSFTHAGEALSLSQSAVSRQISTLEDMLGIMLFQRHARGLVMTEQGELLFNTTREIFGRLALIEGQLVDTKDKAEGPLTITAAEFIGAHWLAPHLRKFSEQFPAIHMTLALDDRVLNLGMREADVAIRLFQPDQPDLVQKHLTTLPFGIFASKSYLETHPAPERVSDLKNHRLIAFPDSTPPPYPNPNWLLRIAGFAGDDRPDALLTNTVTAMATLVRSGYGIGVLPNFIVAHDPTIVSLLPDIKHPGVEMYFVYPEARRHSRRIDMFRDFLIGLAHHPA